MEKFVFDELKIGQEASFERVFSIEDIKKFADLSGDFNPLHIDKAYAEKTEFGGQIVHGMLVGSLFSKLVGMHLPGKNCLYLSQTLQFHCSIKPEEEVRVFGKIIGKSEALKTIEIETKIFDRDNKALITGVAKVRVLK